MTRDDSPGSQDSAAAAVVGYLNFSSGAFDPTAWRAIGELYAACERSDQTGVVEERADTTSRMAATLAERLTRLEAEQPAFRDASQARRMLSLLFEHLVPAYRRFHGDLLEHQPPGSIERPFFLMAAARQLLAGLANADPTDDDQRLVDGAIDRLNDYVGWRPVAVLENGRLSAPYAHERVRPVPLFIAGAGVAPGRYHDLVVSGLDILAAAPPDLLHQADFDPAALEELAFDPRAFDFMHPAASRPNYLFGLWDPARIDEQGRYRRMVLQQATLDGILSWPASTAAAWQDVQTDAELRLEAAAVLAGVMLMASGLSGHGPGAAQAMLGLAELLPRIAGYRDAFYRDLLGRLPPRHRSRLEAEAARLRQPFGGVRQHINANLAGRRARQVEHVALSSVMARLGRSAAAERFAGAVPAASARLFARITGRVVAARRATQRQGDTGAALRELDAATDLLFRAVGCGAAVDPWSILGLAGQFPLHEPGGESLPDPRVDDLVTMTGTILEGYAATWRQAGLAGDSTTAAAAAAALERLAGWWDKHATTSVSGVPHLSGRECLESGREVLEALRLRRQAGPAAPLPGFWRQQVAAFSSPQSHAQAAEALLAEGDLDGAAGLLVHWASLLEGPAVERTGPIWLAAAESWLLRGLVDRTPTGRTRVRRFLELVEANTSGVVDVIEAAAVGRELAADPEEESISEDDDGESGEERVAAAYESMVWQDSTDDGVEGGMLDVDSPFAAGAGGMAAIEDAAEFLTGLVRLFQATAVAWMLPGGPAPAPEDVDSVTGWRHSIRRLKRTMVRASRLVAGKDAEPPPGMPPAEFDRLRWQRDAAAERLIDAAIRAEETLWSLSACLQMGRQASGRGVVGRLFAAVATGDAAAAGRCLDDVRRRLADKPVLYVPLSRGGRPDRIVRARCRERLLERIAAALPRLGLVEETVALVQFAKSLESRRPPGAASVSEFDRVFEAAATGLVERIVESAGSAGPDAAEPDQAVVTARILEGLSLLVPRLLETWMTHARQLRLSVLERVRDEKAFAATQEFVERYGTGLFTQHLLTPPSLRGILRGGVRQYLERLQERDAGGAEPVGIRPERLLADLASGALPLRQAAARIRLVLESVAENHAEYRDWNSTTTQSDRGEMLYILLDLLRLKAEHDRIAWTLRPVSMAHRVLSRRGAGAAAAAWRGRMRDETRDTAAGLVQRLSELESRWGVRLASVGDRVRRPFTAVLEQDELESLVPPAVAEMARGEPVGAGDRLEAKAASFLGVASGSGVEVPEWLDRLGGAVDAELERVHVTGGKGRSDGLTGSLSESMPWQLVSWDALRHSLGG
ncbi:MAG: hypothetical protein FJ284_01145 [Planctomycetes bacterium]|nr:hypothetical protein [Planctomycetota bacterium]